MKQRGFHAKTQRRKKYVIDVNLPYYFGLWNSPSFVHMKDINDEWTDTQIWNYAKEQDLTIVTKDCDFSQRVLLSQPPPRVIHIMLGNMKIKQFHQSISQLWSEACSMSERCRLVRVFEDRIEGIE